MGDRRPESIVRFECLAVVVVVASVLTREREPPGIDLLGDIGLPALMLWLIVRIARRRSSTARAVYTAIWGLLLVGGAYLGHASDWAGLEPVGDTLLFALLAMGQLIPLWTRSSGEWLSRSPGTAAPHVR